MAMKKKQVKEEVTTDFKMAKEVSAFELHQQRVIKPNKVGNFRKYLTDFTRNTGKYFTTRIVDDALMVIRIK